MKLCRSWLFAAALGVLHPSLGAAAGAPADSAGAGAEAAPARPPSKPSVKTQSTTLETTTIEGQILFPKVLFISSEDPARYPQILHRGYLRTALDLGRCALLPKHIEVGTIVSPVPSLPASESAPPNAPEPANSSPQDPEVHP